MTEEPKKNRLTKIEDENPGFFVGISQTMKLVISLVLDGRVSIWLKLLPIVALVYFVVPFPVDALIPLVDDALILGLGVYTFLELCPDEIVEEHRTRIANRYPSSNDEEEIIDADYSSSDENLE